MSQPPEKRGWCTPSEGRKYAGVGEKQFVDWYKKMGLRYSRLTNGRILLRYRWIDAFLESFEEKDEASKWLKNWWVR